MQNPQKLTNSPCQAFKETATRGQFRNYLLLAVALLFACAPLANAQFRASLRGTVSDPTGAVIPGATVTLMDRDTNETRTSVSDGSGLYTFNALPADHYRLKVERQGFKTKAVDEVVLNPDQPNALNLQMELGDAQQTVTVNGSSAPLLDIDTATVSTTISSNQIQHLPSYNRDVFQLAQLAPGVFGDASQGSGGGSATTPGNQGPGGSGSGSAGIFQTENGPQIQARGGQYETNGITVDGISTVSAVWGGTSVITPSEDSVGELKIISNSYDAENGRFSGAQIQITSKSGSNSVHGSAFIKGSRPGLNAYQRWNGLGSEIAGTPSQRGVNKDDTDTNNYGASLGGPIWRDRLFAFFNYEASPQSDQTTAQGWYETPQFDASTAPAGSIASQYLSFPGEGVASSALVQRTCSQAGLVEGTNCKTTTSGLDIGSPLTSALGTQDPTYGNSANTPGLGSGLDNVADIGFFNTVNPTNTTQAQWNGRMDAQVTQKDHAAFAIYWVPVTTTDYNGPTRSANFWHHSQVSDAFSVIWNHTFSPTLLNEARANAAGYRWNEVSTNPQAPFGLPQDNIDDAGTASLNYFGAPGPSNLNQWTYDYNDVLTKILGRHSIKMGGDLTRLYYLNNPVYAARPTFGFRNLWDFANDAPYSESGQFNAATGVPFANRQDNRENLWGVFIQDDYKLRPNLTINAGLRWSYFGAFDSKENNLDVLQFASGSDPLASLSIHVGGPLYTPQKYNFGPQLGFAWLPKQSQNRMVVRGGFGIFYNQNEIAITANGNGNPPNANQINFCCSTPTSSYPGILYETATSINSIFGYAPNPATTGGYNANGFPSSGSPVFVTGFEAHPKSITNYHYSLDMEYQFPYDIVFTLGYQGSESRHLLVQSNYNVVAVGQGNALNLTSNFVDFYANTGTGNYNALITTLKHNFAHQFSVEAQYTFSKALDENSGPYEEDPYPYNSHAAYGRSDYNVTDAFKIFGLWQPVIFHGSHSWVEKVAGGWSLSGIFNWHTGFPLNPTYNTVTDGGLYYNGSGYGSLRPSAYLGGAGTKTGNSVFQSQANPNYGGNGTTYYAPPTFANGPAFPAAAAAPAPGIQRNSINGPRYNDLDGSLTKGFGFPEMKVIGANARLDFRADVYNFFNKTNINGSSIDMNLGSVNPDGSLKSVNSDFGVAGSAQGSRTVQLQARFSF